jgi:arylsulfatase A-like enzyme
MRWAVKAIAGALVVGTIVSGGLAAALIRMEHHLDHGFYARAADTAADAMLRGVGVAVLAALVACALRLLIERVAGPGRNQSLLNFGTFLGVSLPVWFWVPLYSRSLFPGGRGEILTIWSVVTVVHVLGFFVISRLFAARRTPPALVVAASSVCLALLAIVGGVAGTRTFDADDLAQRPNVLLIVLDTVRADRMSSYGYGRQTTPELDAFAAEGIRFSNFYSTSSWTVPSHASIFTGLYPIQHGATQENLSLSNRFGTLAETLDNAGYQTFAASQNPYVSDTVNLAQGFTEFAALWRKWIDPDGTIREAAKEQHLVNEAFEQYLATAPGDRPFFAFLNYIDAHLPTAPPEPFLSDFLRAGVDRDHALEVGRKRWSRYYVGMSASQHDFEVLSDLYDAEMAYMSFTLDKLFASLRRDGRFDNTLIIVTSDHGEQLGDHDHLGHSFALYNTTVQVPLIMRLPMNKEGGRVDDRMGQLVDLFPTILEATGVSYDESVVQGLNLLGDTRDWSRAAVFSEYYYPTQALAMYADEDPELVADGLQQYQRRLRAVEANGKRLIWSSTGDHELYDTASDPGETQNRFHDWPDVAAEMMAMLDAAIIEYGNGAQATRTAVDVPDLDAETEDALRALGYIR